MNCRNGSIYCLVIETWRKKAFWSRAEGFRIQPKYWKSCLEYGYFWQLKKSLKFEYIKKNVSGILFKLVVENT